MRFYDEKDILQIADAGRSKFTHDPAIKDAVLCSRLVSASPKGLEEDVVNSLFDCHVRSSQLL